MRKSAFFALCLASFALSATSPALAAPALAAPALAAPAGKPNPVIIQNTAQLLDECLAHISEKTAETDTAYFANGNWVFPNSEKAYSHQAGAATAAAVLWKWRELNKASLDEAARAKQDSLHRIAVTFFDHAIKERLSADGLYDKGGAETAFFATELATTLLTLRDSLNEETRGRWVEALQRMVNRWMKNGELPNPSATGWKATDGWYTNGNFELEEAELIYLMWKITGEQRYKDLFEVQWKHTLTPDHNRWGKAGYGFFYLKEPTREDGSDGAGYLAEAEQEPGFDKDYGQVQLTMATRLYVLSKDPRVLRLMNLLFNALLPKVDEKTWILDATYGSRHSLHLPFFSTGLPVLAFWGGRSDLLPKVAEHFEKGVKPIHLHNAKNSWGNAGIYLSYGSNLAVLLQATYE